MKPITKTLWIKGLFLAMLAAGQNSLHAQYTLTVESAPAVGAGETVYRFYVNMLDPTDRMSAVFGNDQSSLIIDTPSGAFNSPYNTSWNASGINPAFLLVFPDLADDTYATIGLSGPASTSGLAGAADPSIVEDANQPVTPYFLTPGATNLTSTTLTGASWYILNTATNGLPDGDLRVLIAQVTTAGDISGQMNYQVFPLSVGSDQVQMNVEFSGTGTFGVQEVPGCVIELACNYNPDATVDDGSCDFTSCLAFGCTDLNACNYDPDAEFEDGTCIYPQFPYDCNGNCLSDDDGDGVCDEFEIFGCTDSEACNYSDAATNDDGSCSFDCSGCTFPTACNYNPTATEDDGSCDFFSCAGLGCTDMTACNYDVDALLEDGSCQYPDFALDCDGNCLNDANEDGICDEFQGPGCTSTCACNYDALATEDDGSCEYSSCAGCIYSEALNFDSQATLDDGSCLWQGCKVEGFLNFDPFANFDGSCTNMANSTDLNNDGETDALDLVDFLVVYGAGQEEIQDFVAIVVNGIQNVMPCTTPTISVETLIDSICPECCSDSGCMYPSALNYDSTASVDAGSCVFAGCTDPTANNYKPNANIDDGSCSMGVCPDFDENGVVNLLDLLIFLLGFGS